MGPRFHPAQGSPAPFPDIIRPQLKCALGAMNTFLLLVIALAVIGTLGIFLGEIFVLMIAVALAMFYAALFLFAPTTIDAIPDATKNVLIIAMMVGAVLSLILGQRRKI